MRSLNLEHQSKEFELEICVKTVDRSLNQIGIVLTKALTHGVLLKFGVGLPEKPLSYASISL